MRIEDSELLKEASLIHEFKLLDWEKAFIEDVSHSTEKGAAMTQQEREVLEKIVSEKGS